jgi:hypothetical protein
VVGFSINSGREVPGKEKNNVIREETIIVNICRITSHTVFWLG